MKKDINTVEVNTVADLKEFVAEELATFDTVEVLNFQIDKMLETLEDSPQLGGYEKQYIHDIKHILWASDALRDDTLKRIRTIVESEGNNDDK